MELRIIKCLTWRLDLPTISHYTNFFLLEFAKLETSNKFLQFINDISDLFISNYESY